MSDVEPPTEDELVSAYLDDEVTAAERAQVEADPVLTAMVGRFDAASQLMSGTVTAPADALERSLAAALDAFDQQQTGRDQHLVAPGDSVGSEEMNTSAVEAPVVSLASVRRNRRLVTVLGAAAATLIAVLGVSAFLPRDDVQPAATSSAYEAADAAAGDATSDSDSDAVESKAVVASPAPTAADSINQSAVVTPSPPTNSFVQTPINLATQPDTAAVTDAFVTVLEVDTATRTANPVSEPVASESQEAESEEAVESSSELVRDPFVECLAAYRADGAVVLGVGMRATVTIGDLPALVFEITDANGQRDRVVIVNEASCEVLEERDL